MRSSQVLDQLPRASHPPSESTISTNRLDQPKFPYSRLSSLPSLSYALENLMISLLTLGSCLVESVVTLYLWVPLGLLRTLIDLIIDPLLRLITSSDQRLTQDEPNRVIVISGASSGIGAALVKAYAAPNVVLILLARDPGRLNYSAKMARSLGSRAVETHSIDYEHDSADREIKEVIHDAHQKYGSLDLVISCTGTVAFTDDDPSGPTPWGAHTANRLNKINVTSTYTYIMNAWEIMKKQRSGKICIIASSVALYGPPQFAIYGATKANLLSFSQALRSLSTAYGIQVTAICPGFIESGMTKDMMAAGSRMPEGMLANTDQMAKRIKKAIEEEQPVVIWPLSHVLPLVMANRLNWLNADLGRWVASHIGINGQMVS